MRNPNRNKDARNDRRKGAMARLLVALDRPDVTEEARTRMEVEATVLRERIR